MIEENDGLGYSRIGESNLERGKINYETMKGRKNDEMWWIHIFFDPGKVITIFY